MAKKASKDKYQKYQASGTREAHKKARFERRLRKAKKLGWKIGPNFT
jgi:hypothetical protein